MTPKTYPRLSVENFGPIKSGSVELKPLTIFIGPNNSGKSYMATLAYVLLKAFNTQLGRPFTTKEGELYARIFPMRQDDSFLVRMPSFVSWLATVDRSSLGSNTHFSSLPMEIQNILADDLAYEVDLFQHSLRGTLADYFHVADLTDLVQRKGTPLHIRLIAADQPDTLIDILVTAREVTVKVNLPRKWLEGQHFPMRLWLNTVDNLTPEQRADYLRERLNESLRLNILMRNGLRADHTHYLPTARSGILQAYQTYNALAVSLLRNRGGGDFADLPLFQGVLGDFFQALTRKGRRRSGSPSRDAALALLEMEIMHGRISLQQGQAGQSQFVYTTGDVALPMERVSSMVAELAPLALWIEDLAPHDCLCIDEPEAHLHPENQRLVARVLARLVRAQLRVICPTHSSLILHQISNHLIASKLPAAKRAELGYTDDDVLSADEVAVYLFSPEEEGTVIRPVDIDPEFGIDEEEFVRVSQAIGNETYYLSVAAREEADTTLVHP